MLALLFRMLSLELSLYSHVSSKWTYPSEWSSPEPGGQNPEPHYDKRMIKRTRASLLRGRGQAAEGPPPRPGLIFIHRCPPAGAGGQRGRGGGKHAKVQHFIHVENTRLQPLRTTQSTPACVSIDLEEGRTGDKWTPTPSFLTSSRINGF